LITCVRVFRRPGGADRGHVVTVKHIWDSVAKIQGTPGGKYPGVCAPRNASPNRLGRPLAALGALAGLGWWASCYTGLQQSLLIISANFRSRYNRWLLESQLLGQISGLIHDVCCVKLHHTWHASCYRALAAVQHTVADVVSKSHSSAIGNER